jgi:hypothetical protein
MSESVRDYFADDGEDLLYGTSLSSFFSMNLGSITPPTSAWEAARLAGCDMSLIEANLELSYTERCVRHDRAITSAMALREAALNQIHGLSDAIEAVSRQPR